MTETVQVTPIPRMRTAAKIVAEIRALDPESDVTEYWVRHIAKSGTVPVIWAGNKCLINLNDVLDLLRVGMEKPKAAPAPTIGGIRRIEE